MKQGLRIFSVLLSVAPCAALCACASSGNYARAGGDMPYASDRSADAGQGFAVQRTDEAVDVDVADERGVEYAEALSGIETAAGAAGGAGMLADDVGVSGGGALGPERPLGQIMAVSACGDGHLATDDDALGVRWGEDAQSRIGFDFGRAAVTDEGAMRGPRVKLGFQYRFDPPKPVSRGC